MNKRLKTFAAIWIVCSALYAQNTTKTDNELHEDNSAFTFTESQLSESDDAIQSVSSVLSSNSDVYLSNVGYLFSPMRFKLKAYDSQYNDIYINGLRVNDKQSGRFSFGMIGGLNNATRNSESNTAFESSNFGYSPVGGITNYEMRASQFGKGQKLSIAGANRNYMTRAMYQYATGLTKNGWAFTAGLSYRWAKRGNIKGTNYNSLGYYLMLDKVWDKHMVSLTTFGSPTERAQQAAATEESYWIANSHYYNPNWGYQQGKVRNARTTRSFEPTTLLSWIYDINKNTKLTTTAMFKYTKYSTTSLGWNGNAADPRPDYYKNLPSSVYNVYTGTPTSSELALFWDRYNTLSRNEAARQIDWDAMYYANRQANSTGKDALYYVERRHSDQMEFALSSFMKHSFDKAQSINFGLQLSTTKAMNYKTMDDLLGATSYTDIDKYALRDYGYGSQMIQNDMNNPNRKIGEGDRFGYDYNTYTNKGDLWLTYNVNDPTINAFISGRIGGTDMWRYGNMRNGRAANKSFGNSGKAHFLDGGLKTGITWKLPAGHSLSIGASYDNRAPEVRNSFIAPRIKNDFILGLSTEDIVNGEITYLLTNKWISLHVSGYYTKFMNGTEQTAFYSDEASRFTYLTLSDITKEHYGVEAAFNLKLIGDLSMTGVATINEAKYVNNPNALLTYENENQVTFSKEYCNGMRVGSTPLSAFSLGFNYNIKNWYFSINGNYYDRVYTGFSQYNRLESVMTKYTPTSVNANGDLVYSVDNAYINQNGGLLYDNDGNLVRAVSHAQEKNKGGFMFDASIGKSLSFRNGNRLNLNLTLNNIFNNTNMRTGGYEQNRDDKYENGTARTYVFSKNNKYYYAQGFNFMMNVGYVF